LNEDLKLGFIKISKLFEVLTVFSVDEQTKNKYL